MIFPVAQVLIGTLVLLTGYRLYWVLVGVAGFLVGSSLAEQMWPGLTPAALFATACLIGLVGVLIALVAQKLAIATAGFAIGTYTLATAFMAFGFDSTAWGWLALGLGGVGGGLLAFLVFDLSLIVLSALGGAFMIADVLPWDHRIKLLALAILGTLGLAIQTKQYRKSKTDGNSAISSR